MEREGVRWIYKVKPLEVRFADVCGCPEEAQRVGRLCARSAAQGASLEEVRNLKRGLLKEIRTSFGAPKRRMLPASKRRKGWSAGAPAEEPRLVLSTLPVRDSEHNVGPSPPEKGAKRLYDMMNAREQIARLRAAGESGAQLYASLPSELASYFSRRSCPNVRRREDRTTRSLHKLARASDRFALCSNDLERHQLKRLLVLNFAVWRFLGGTLPFARAVGFLTDWTEVEKDHVRNVVRTAFQEGRAQSLFCDAYESTGKIRKAFGSSCDEAKLEALLHNRGPKALINKEPLLTFFSLHGKFRVIDLVWQASDDVVRSALPDAHGDVRSQRVANVLGRIPYFGRDENGFREPTFFAKEIVQDLLDTPVFEGGRAAVADLRSFCPAGPGAVLGLMLVFGLKERPLQKDAVPMMRALLEAAPKHWTHGSPETLELHDIQFMLCEVQKLFHAHNALNNLRDYRVHNSSSDHFAIQGAMFHWNELVENAVLLSLAQRASSPNSSVPEDELLHFVIDWLGLPTCLCSGEAELRHADRVMLMPVFQSDAIQKALGFEAGKKDGFLVPAAPGSDATEFQLERKAGRGLLRHGDEIWLRAAGGAHLGPQIGVSSSRSMYKLSAPGKSQRYDQDRLFGVEDACVSSSLCNNDAAPLYSGSAIHLRDSSLRYLHASSGRSPLNPCTVRERSSTGLTDTDGTFIFGLVRSSVNVEFTKRLYRHLEQVVRDALALGRLIRSQDGTLRLSHPEEVRRRLVGSASA
eukprot:TRINITY_DN22501_c0_g1_i1.p1 TRINITY_DN22501_c0_g1~~TRINITY_DN22501_c0_g1_i1.p1  ORF type:complete len:835 (-),score=121.07 TRINITY_DN22501_c0_g1_i1:94-2346(-)